MYSTSFEVPNDFTGCPMPDIERIVLYKTVGKLKQVIDVAEFENDGPDCWTREEILGQMRKRNNIGDEVSIAV